MSTNRLILFAGTAIAVVSLFVSCNDQEKIPDEGNPQVPNTEVVLKDGEVREHDFTRLDPVPLDVDISQEEAELFLRSDSFAIKMFNAICESEADENFCISPLSLQVLMSILSNGVSDGAYLELSQAMFGETVDIDLLNSSYGKLKNALERTNCVKLANAMWLQTGTTIYSTYSNLVQQYYNCETGYLDFRSDTQASLDSICQWAYENTYGKQKKLDLENFGTTTSMVLANTAWFASAWYKAFDKSETYTGEFTMANGQTQDVDMMKGTRAEFCLFKNPEGDYKIVSLPFKDKSFWMDIVVPNENVDLDSIIPYVDWSVNIDKLETQVNLTMPKFRISTDIKLRPILESLGASAPFQSLPKIASLLFADCINQTANIIVSEEGVEASAASVSRFTYSIPYEMIIDRPFAYAIRDSAAGTLLFMGRVNKIDQ